MSHKVVETLAVVLAACLVLKFAAGVVSAILPALIPVFVMALVAVVVMRWRGRL